MNDTPRAPHKIAELTSLVTARDLTVLSDLEAYRLLSTRQIQRLRFHQHASLASGTRTAIRILGRLEGHGFISRLARRIGGTARGSAATVWQLASTGERLLRALNGEPNRRRYVEPSTQFIDHTLAVAELAVTLIEQSRLGHFDILELLTEPDCWRTYTGASGAAEWLKPDLHVVTADSNFEAHAFIEIDRGSEHLPAIIRKCLAYQRYWRSGIEQTRLDLFPAVVWVVPDETRAQKMRTAIRGEPALTADLFHIVSTVNAANAFAPNSPITNSPKGGTP